MFPGEFANPFKGRLKKPPVYSLLGRVSYDRHFQEIIGSSGTAVLYMSERVIYVVGPP